MTCPCPCVALPALTDVAHRTVERAVEVVRASRPVALSGGGQDAADAGTGTPLIAVDATAGNGHDTVFLARIVGEGGLVAAFDVQVEALEATRLRLAGEGLEGRVQLVLAGHEVMESVLFRLVSGRVQNERADMFVAPPFLHNDCRVLAQKSLWGWGSGGGDLSSERALPQLHLSANNALPQLHFPANNALPQSSQSRESVATVMFNLGFLPGSDKRTTTHTETTLQALHAATRLLAPHGLLSVHMYTGHPGGREEGEAVLAWSAALPWNAWRCLTLSQHNKSKNQEWLLLVERL